MPESRSKLSEVIDIRSASPAPSGGPSRLLAKAETLEVRLLTIAKGREIPPHHARGEITVHCLEGRIAFTAAGTMHELGPGQMLILAAGAPHSLVGLEDAAVLVTKVLPANLATARVGRPIKEFEETAIRRPTVSEEAVIPR